jgi:hypothetical protein
VLIPWKSLAKQPKVGPIATISGLRRARNCRIVDEGGANRAISGAAHMPTDNPKTTAIWEIRPSIK